MSAFLFIWQKSLRNFIRQLPKKPARFILVLLYTAFFVLAIASVSFMPRAESGRLIEQANGASILQVGWFSLILLIGTAVLYSGTNRGSAVFSGADVHFLFTAPYRPQTILIYGLAGMMKSMALLAVFLPFQFPNLVQLGLGLPQLFSLIGLFVWILICFNLLSMVLYLLAQNKPRIRLLIRILVLAVPAAFVIAMLFSLIQTRSLMQVFDQFANSPFVRLFPFFGWNMSVASGIIAGFDNIAVLSVLLLLATPFATFRLVYRLPADFYEDAILKVEQQKQQQEKMKGKRNRQASSLQKRFKGKSGLRHGYGPNSIFFRAVREMRRRQPFVLSLAATILLLATTGVWIGLSLERETEPFRIYAVFLLPLIQLFVRAGETFAADELKRPLIYMLPYPATQKLFWMTVTESFLNLPLILPSLITYALLVKPPPGQFMAVMPALLTFPLLLTASTLLTFRIMGSIEGQLDGLVQVVTNMILILPTFGLLGAAIVRGIRLNANPSSFFLMMALAHVMLGGTLILLAGRSSLERGLVKS